MKRKISFILILTIILFSLTGCYDSNGIEEFYYIVAIAIDKSDNGNISLSIQTAKPSGSSDGSTSQSNEYKIYTVDCESIEAGITILNNYLNKKINLSHCSAIVFSEEIARDGVKPYINLFGNDTEVRPSCNIIVSSQKAVDVLNKVSNSGESFSSRLYEYILNSVDYTGYTVDATFSGFFSKINSNQTQATAIYSVVNEDSVQNCGAAVFKGDKMVGTLTPLETIAYLIVNNDLASCMITIDNPFNSNDLIDLNLKRIKSPDIDVSLINNTPLISIDLCIQASIDSSGEEFDYTNTKNIKTVEEATNKYLEQLIKEYVYKITKDYNSDVAGFGGYLASKYLTNDKFEKVYWNEIFKDSYFDVKVNTTITSSHLFNKE